MAQYTTLNTSEIKSICKEFKIGDIISYKVLSGGSENTNYHIISEVGKYVLSISEQKSLSEAKDLAHLLEHLRKHHFRTSEIIRTKDNKPVTLWKGKPLMIKKFIEGKIVKDLSPGLLKLIGKEVGKLHKIDPPEYVPTQLNYGKEHFRKVNDYAAGSLFNDWLEDVLDVISSHIHPDLPRVFIHSDLFWDNVIISEDESSVTIMDFEEAAHYYRVFDIGMTIIGVCGEGIKVNLEKARHLLLGYREEIQLLDIEINALKAFTIYAGASMTFWRHMNFNYTNSTPGMEDHYLGLKVLTDYIMAQPDDCFISIV